ncbi:MAG: SemiSWEET transporter [Candidatus Baltobacteraceae bacterium]
MSALDLLGLSAGTLTTLSFMPQMLRIVKRRSADDLSYGALAFFILGISLWVWYGIALHSLPILLTNAVTLALNFSILVLKIAHDRRRALE